MTLKRLSFLFLCLIIVFTSCNYTKKPDTIQEEETALRGVWVASVINLDYPSRSGLSEATLKKEVEALLDGAADLGMNAVFVQVRPCGDALYPSKLFPWSKYLTGVQGTPPDRDFDPLAFWINEAHKRGVKLHAWINPFRVTRGGTETAPRLDINELSSNHPGRLNPEWCVGYKGNLYFNPGIPEVIDYIVGGVEELINNYAVDGVHFDDYFYPGTDFDDSAEYERYADGFESIGDWRRDNINTLIKKTNDMINVFKPEAEFGVSPFGIWQNSSSSELGSETRGLESYKTYYCDTRKWVRNEWLDYIAPQIYWHIGNEAADYAKLLDWWARVVRGTAVKLYVGHAGYRVLEAKPGEVWYGADELLRQLELNKQYSEVSGSIHFRLGMYLQSDALKAALKSEYAR